MRVDTGIGRYEPREGPPTPSMPVLLCLLVQSEIHASCFDRGRGRFGWACSLTCSWTRRCAGRDKQYGGERRGDATNAARVRNTHSTTGRGPTDGIKFADPAVRALACVSTHVPHEGTSLRKRLSATRNLAAVWAFASVRTLVFQTVTARGERLSAALDNAAVWTFTSVSTRMRNKGTAPRKQLSATRNITAV